MHVNTRLVKSFVPSGLVQVQTPGEPEPDLNLGSLLLRFRFAKFREPDLKSGFRFCPQTGPNRTAATLYAHSHVKIQALDAHMSIFCVFRPCVIHNPVFLSARTDASPNRLTTRYTTLDHRLRYMRPGLDYLFHWDEKNLLPPDGERRVAHALQTRVIQRQTGSGLF